MLAGAVLANNYSPVRAQGITLYFPHFAGEEYDFYVFRGEKTDTISTGRIGEDGYVYLSTSPKSPPWEGTSGNSPSLGGGRGEVAGMGRWLLRNGGGLDFIINGEDFSVSCTEAMPNDNNIVYEGSRENDYLHELYYRQQEILQKAGALQMLINAYTNLSPDPSPQERGGARSAENDALRAPSLVERAGGEVDAMLALVELEVERQNKLFEELVNETRQSSLYAARYHRISDFYNWIPLYSILNNNMMNEKKRLAERRRFISEELDMDALYTSGLWNAVISQTFELYPDKAEFGDAMVKALKRTRSQAAFEQLATDLVTITEQYGWEEAGEKIVGYLIQSGRIEKANARLERAFTVRKAKPGDKAPALHLPPTPLRKRGEKSRRPSWSFTKRVAGHARTR